MGGVRVKEELPLSPDETQEPDLFEDPQARGNPYFQHNIWAAL